MQGKRCPLKMACPTKRKRPEVLLNRASGLFCLPWVYASGSALEIKVQSEVAAKLTCLQSVVCPDHMVDL